MTARLRRVAFAALIFATSCTGSTEQAVPVARPEGARKLLFEPRSISFPDREHGWAFNGACDEYDRCNDLWATTDGGDTWAEVPAPMGLREPDQQRRTDPATQAVHSVVFADERSGWLVEPGLFVTRDGGASWYDDSRDGAVFDLAAADGWVWALERPPCPDQSWPCRRQVAHILRGRYADELEPLENQPARVEWSTQLVVVDARRAYLVVDQGDPAEVLATDDGGSTWRRAEAPCHRDTVRLHVLGPGRLWLTCTLSPIGTRHWQSIDDGRSWEPAPFPKTGDDATGPFALDAGRILYDKGDSKGLRLSTDWGVTDQVVLPTPESARGMPTMVELHRPDADHLWLLTRPIWPSDPEADPRFIFRPGRSLLRSGDGGRTWSVTQVK